MKKFYAYFMAALVAVFVLAACGTPNEPNQDQPDVPGNDTTVTPGGNDSTEQYLTLIVGSWEVDSVITAYTNPPEEYFNKGNGWIMTFNADRTGTSGLEFAEEFHYTYTIEAGILKMIDEDNEEECYIINTLNETQMKLWHTDSGQTYLETTYLHRVNQ